MKNCVSNLEAIKFAIESAKKIMDTMGKVNLVFPSYKIDKEKIKKNYHDFAEAMARMNLLRFDDVNVLKNKFIIELYEMAAAIHEIAIKALKDLEDIESVNLPKHKSKINILPKVACLL